MKIATVFSPPPPEWGPLEVSTDTVDSMETWAGDRVLVLANQSAWPAFENVRFGSAKIEQGFLFTPGKHNANNGPYRNGLLGMKKLYEYWPDSDWFLYTDYDCLFTSDAFKSELAKADRMNAWCAGNDLRRFDFQMPVFQTLLNSGPIRYSYYMLGCYMFLSRAFLAKLHEIGFIDRLLQVARQLPYNGFFPEYPRWDFQEELWPTAAVQLGGSLYELACWKGADRQWHPRYTDDAHAIYAEGDDTPSWRGNFPVHTVRYQPGVKFEETSAASIIHPVKGFDNPIRVYHRQRRKAFRGLQATLHSTVIVSA